jgi:hypothetical protein
MPLPLVVAGGAMLGGAAFSVGTGYLIDRYVFKSDQYTPGEAATDVALGMFGGGLLRPGLRIGWKGQKAIRSTYTVGKQTASRYGIRSTNFMSDTSYAAAYFGVRALRGNVTPVVKATAFIAAGRGVDHLLESQARSHRSPNSTVDPGTPRNMKLPRGGKRPKSAKKKPAGRCPPGHYWSWKHNACMPSRF